MTNLPEIRPGLMVRFHTWEPWGGKPKIHEHAVLVGWVINDLAYTTVCCSHPSNICTKFLILTEDKYPSLFQTNGGLLKHPTEYCISSPTGPCTVKIPIVEGWFENAPEIVGRHCYLTSDELQTLRGELKTLLN